MYTSNELLLVDAKYCCMALSVDALLTTALKYLLSVLIKFLESTHCCWMPFDSNAALIIFEDKISP